jgi:hypothetical protein
VTWTTATEQNSYGFEIEKQALSGLPAGTRSVQAGQRSAAGEWSKVGFVPASGSSNTPHGYGFTDRSVSAGNHGYRLKQIDKNGTIKYSQEAFVEVSVPKVFSLDQNFPNPFNPTTNIEFTLQQNGRAVVRIYNVLGQQVATVFDQEAEAGRIYQAQFNAARFTSGVYVSVLESGGKQLLRKMVLLK